MPNTSNEMSLLNQARRVLLDDLLPELPEAARYRARMVANTMAIAARVMSDGGRIQEAERKALAELYNEATGPAGHVEAEQLDEAVTRLNWWLTAEIRAGRRDSDAQVHDMLRDGALARLRLANPKAAPAREKSGAD